jgi:hypothetical protein
VLRTATVIALLLPVLLTISSPTAPRGSFPNPAEPATASPLFLPAVHPLEPVAEGLLYAFAAWGAIGVIMLYLRYRRSQSEDRRRIRWLLVGVGSATVVCVTLFALAWSLEPGFVQDASILFLWLLGWCLSLAP